MQCTMATCSWTTWPGLKKRWQKLLLVGFDSTVLSRKYAPPRDNAPPPIVLMKTTAQVLLSVKTLTVTNYLCDVYKILYYAAVYVRGNMLS